MDNMWIYIIILISQTWTSQTIPCPKGLKDCNTIHTVTHSKEDTVTIEKYCELQDATNRYKDLNSNLNWYNGHYYNKRAKKIDFNITILDSVFINK
jgi:hypothetical protein